MSAPKECALASPQDLQIKSMDYEVLLNDNHESLCLVASKLEEMLEGGVTREVVPW